MKAYSCTIIDLLSLIGGGAGQVRESVDKADLLSDHFDGKHSRELLICCSLAICLLDLSPLPSGRVRSDISF